MNKKIKVMPTANADMEAIWWYGYWNFGLEKTEKYVRSLYRRFDQLATFELGRWRKDLGEQLFAIPHQQHVIYYRTQHDYVLIIRILHHTQDVHSHFAKEKWL